MTTPPPEDPFATPATGAPAPPPQQPSWRSGYDGAGGAPQQYGAPQPYGPSPYGQPAPYGRYGPPVQQTESRAVIALVLAISSFVVFPILPAVVALVLARGAQDEIDLSAGRLTGSGLVTAARVLSWINLGLAGLVLLLLVLALGLFTL